MYPRQTFEGLLVLLRTLIFMLYPVVRWVILGESLKVKEAQGIRGERERNCAFNALNSRIPTEWHRREKLIWLAFQNQDSLLTECSSSK